MFCSREESTFYFICTHICLPCLLKLAKLETHLGPVASNFDLVNTCEQDIVNVHLKCIAIQVLMELICYSTFQCQKCYFMCWIFSLSII